MNVKQLRNMLRYYPDELEIVVDLHSDYAPILDVRVIKIERDGDEEKRTNFLCIEPVH